MSATNESANWTYHRLENEEEGEACWEITNGTIWICRTDCEDQAQELCDMNNAISKHRLDAERLANVLESLFSLVNGETPRLLEDDHHYSLVEEALAAHREVLK